MPFGRVCSNRTVVVPFTPHASVYPFAPDFPSFQVPHSCNSRNFVIWIIEYVEQTLFEIFFFGSGSLDST